MTARSLFFVACAGLVALLWFFTDAAKTDSLGDTARAQQERSTGAGGVFAMSTLISTQAPTPATAAAPIVSPSSPQPPPLPFAFLGTITEAGETYVVLYGGGRTLKVRDTGRLDDNYEVDAILEDVLVLRYVPLGTKQVLELASRQPPVAPSDPDADSTQD